MQPINICHKKSVAILYAIALFLDRLDITMVNMTFPAVAMWFGISIVTTQWLSTIFLLAMAISIPVSGWLGERFGLKRMFLFSLFLFGFGSTLCSLSPNIYVFMLFRFLQGVGGGMLIPIGMTYLYRVFDKSEYVSITSYTFLPALIAPAVGPFLGGVCITWIGWKSVFLFSGPICLVLAAVSSFLLQEINESIKTPFDWLGFILSSLFFINLFLSFSFLERGKVQPIYVTFFLIFLVILGALFVLREKQTLHPMINLTHFKNTIFQKSIFIQLCFQMCHFGGFFIVGLYLQLGAGISPIKTGLIIGMQAIGAMCTSRISVKLFHKISARFPIILGFIGIGILTPCVFFIQNENYFVFALLLFLCRGFFSGLCGTPIQALSVLGFEKNQLGNASSIFNICRQVSISLGVVLSSVFVSFGLKNNASWHLGETMSFPQAFSIFQWGIFAITATAILGIVVAWGIGEKRK